MKRYVLRETLDGQPIHDGIFPGLGIIQHGEPFTPTYAEQEEQVKADPRFKEYRATVSEDATVKEAAEADTKKPAKSGKEVAE